MDLNRAPLDQYAISLTLQVILYTFKNIWHMDDEKKLKEWILLARDLFFEESGLKILEKLLLYIYCNQNIKPMALKSVISTLISEEKGEIAMTTAERLLKEGVEKGVEKGIEKRDRELVLNMQKNGFDLQSIKLATNLSLEKIRSIIEKPSIRNR